MHVMILKPNLSNYIQNESIVGYFAKWVNKILWDGNEGISKIQGFNKIQFERFCRFINKGLT